MDMKRTGWKQLALSVAGAFVCRISVMDVTRLYRHFLRPSI